MSEFTVGVTTPVHTTNLLDDFKADMAEDVELPRVEIPHKYRKGYKLRFDVELPLDQLKSWQSQCKRNTRAGGEIDQLKICSMVIANKCIAVIRNGEEVLDDQGNLVTFGHPAMWEPFGATDSLKAVQGFMGNDGFLIATAETVMRAAGYDDEVAPDPTNAS